MTAERLSALDASFLAVESPAAPMHVGWVAVFDPPEHRPRPGFPELFEHIAGRLGRAPRYRQRLVDVPLGLHEPVWVDDADFDPAGHLLRADGEDLTALVDTIFSSPLPRERPLWKIWIADALPEGRLALVGKMHHCMVDGTALVELGNLLLDPTPEPKSEDWTEQTWSPAPPPSARGRLARAALERAGDAGVLALAPLRLASSPSRPLGLPGVARRGARTMAHRCSCRPRAHR